MTRARRAASTARASTKAARRVGEDVAPGNRADAAVLPAGDFDHAHDFARANLDALVRANAAAVRGLDELGQAWIALAQEAVEQSAAATGAMLGAGSLRELVELQGSYARSAVDRLLTEGLRLSELGVRTANEAIGPLNERVRATVESFGRGRAA